jgi:hypothetical protein
MREQPIDNFGVCRDLEIAGEGAIIWIHLSITGRVTPGFRLGLIVPITRPPTSSRTGLKPAPLRGSCKTPGQSDPLRPGP